MWLLISAAQAVALGLLAWRLVGLRHEWRHDAAPRTRRKIATGTLYALMAVALVLPFALREPPSTLWLSPCAVSVAVIVRLRRKKRNRTIRQAAWSLLLASLVAHALWLGPKLFAGGAAGGGGDGDATPAAGP